MKNGNLSNKIARYVFIDSESLFNFKVIPVLKSGVNEKIKLLLREFNVALLLDKKCRRLERERLDEVVSTIVIHYKKKDLALLMEQESAILLVSAERLIDFKDFKNVYPFEMSINSIKELA